MKKLTIIMALILVAVTAAQSQHRPRLGDAPDIPVKIVAAPGTSIELTRAAIQAERGRNLFGARFTIKDRGIDRLVNVRLLLVSVGPDGVVKSGEVICERDLPSPGKEREYTVPLASKFDFSGDYAVVSILQTRRAGGQQENISPTLIMEAVQFHREVIASPSVNESLSPNADCGSNFCGECRQIAFDVCARQGIHQFSCSIKDCSCSFTCN